MKQSYQANIYYLYIIKLSKWLMLIMPIVALFYNENGLNDLDIYILQAIYSLSVVFLEIPSGYMADVLGRKKTLILGSILGTAGYGIYAIAPGFHGFLVAEIVLGFGGSFISGADSALLYDSLLATRQKHRYLQYEGRITSLGNFAETTAAICGGLIAAYISYRAVYFAQTFIAAMAIPASLLLVEPRRKETIERPGIAHILEVCRYSLWANQKLSTTICLSATTGIATLCMAWSTQIYLVGLGFNEWTITPLWVTLNLTVAFVAAFASQSRKILGAQFSLLLIIYYIPTTYILLGIFPLAPALLSLYLFYAIRGYATPVLKNFINQNCQSHVRATVLSLRNLIIRFGFAIIGPLIGVLSQSYSLKAGLIVAGTLLFFASAFNGYRLRKHLPSAFTSNK